MKLTRHVLFVLVVLAATFGLTAATWYGTVQAIHLHQAQVRAQAVATLGNDASNLDEQLNRQILAIDQTLRFLADQWQKDPGRFDLESQWSQAVALTGLAHDIVLTDRDGLIRRSSVPEAVGRNVSAADCFRALSDRPANNGLCIGSASIDGVMRQWHMNVARALRSPDGTFAGIIATDYRLAAISDAFSGARPGASAFLALVGTADGRLRDAVGPAAIDQDLDVAGTPMFRALARTQDGVWTGPSPTDAIRRIHVFRTIPGRNLTLVVALGETEAMAPARAYRLDAEAYAGVISLLLIILAATLIHSAWRARWRDRQSAEGRAMLAASNAQLEVARAEAAAKAERLEATLRGMADGVSMIDAHMCLVEWNAKFPEIAGVPPEILRVGLPMEEILRAQVATGQFGAIADPHAEVQRRMARLRVAPFGVTQRLRPDGRTLELRRTRLPDGGFVTLYADITEHKRTEAALRKAQAEAEAANAARSAFMAMVSHEIRTPLNALLNTVRLLSDSTLTPAQHTLVALARQSGDALFGLINDVLEMTRAEAGKITIRHSLFELRRLLENAADMLSVPAAERGISFAVRVAPEVPAIIRTDPSRLRQVLLNLMSNAAKYADPGLVTVTAEMTADAHRPLRLTVCDPGPCISEAARAHLFQPFSRLDGGEGLEAAGTGLGLSISRHLVTLMDGMINCELWSDATGAGNAFWLALPASSVRQNEADVMELASVGTAGMEALPTVARPRLPRTRVLLVEDVAANQHVTAALLRRNGHSVEIAGDGEAAIRALKNRPYDVVLMDIFMPNMSGIETTRIIRSMAEPARSVPIVALTANASPGDAEVFRETGMNGTLSKPVALAEMLAVILGTVWRPWQENAETAAAQPWSGETNVQAMPVLSTERVDELRANLPPHTFADLVEECITDIELRLPALRRAITAGAPAAIRAQAHTMIGLAAGYGMGALEARLRCILQAVTEGSADAVSAGVVRDIEDDFALARDQLRKLTYGDFDRVPQAAS